MVLDNKIVNSTAVSMQTRQARDLADGLCGEFGAFLQNLPVGTLVSSIVSYTILQT